MKITTDVVKAFRTVTVNIVISSQKELDALYSLFGAHSVSSLAKPATDGAMLTKSVAEEVAGQFIDGLYDALEKAGAE